MSGHHATDTIAAACGTGGDVVLHGGPVRTWAAGPRAATRYRRGGHPARRTSPSASLPRWGSLAAWCPAGVSEVPGPAAGVTRAGAGRGRGGRWPGAGVSGRWQAADFEQFEPERLELREHAIQCGAVGQRPGQHGVAAAGLGLQGRECGAYRLAQAAADTDAIPVGRPVGVGTGHVRTAHTLNRPAGGCTVAGTCTGDPSCSSGSSPRAAARPGSGRRTIMSASLANLPGRAVPLPEL